MSWRNRVALFALTVFTALPLAGTLCAAVCDSAANTPSHHASKKDCDEPAVPSSAVLRGSVDHDCTSHGDAIGPTVATAAGRADIDVTSSPPLTVAGLPTAQPPSNGGSEFRPRPLTDSTPPGTPPLVLRV